MSAPWADHWTDKMIAGYSPFPASVPLKNDRKATGDRRGTEKYKYCGVKKRENRRGERFGFRVQIEWVGKGVLNRWRLD